jgi:hypothetical protein
VAITLPPESHHKGRRDEELSQGAAEQSKELTTHAEYDVAGLMNCEVETVEPAELAGCAQNLPTVYAQEDGQAASPAAFPSRVATNAQISSAYESAALTRLS